MAVLVRRDEHPDGGGIAENGTVLILLPAIAAGIWTTARPRLRAALRTALIVGAMAATVGPATVVAARFRERLPAMSLDGLEAMAWRHPGDAAVVRHLWRHASEADVVLEAVGRSYSYGARVSFMTGQPTLLGWEDHERLWRRGVYWTTLINERARVVDAIYAGPLEDVRALLDTYEVRHIVVGAVERRRYPGVTAVRFAGVADVVLDQEGTVLLRVR